MAELKQCEFFLLRYVPDAVKDEFVNIGVVMLGPTDGVPTASLPFAAPRMGNPETGSPAAAPQFVEVRMTQDWRRVRCLDPQADVEMLEAIGAEVQRRLTEGREGRQRILHLLRDSFSNTVQATLPKACLAESPALEVGKLAEIYLETRRRAGQRDNAGRGAILARMRNEFERAGVWGLMRKKVAVSQYTHKGDPLKLDCGYRPNGVIRFFQATPLATDIDAAKVLAFSYPQIAEGVLRVEKAKTELTAIVEDDLDCGDEAVTFAIETMMQSNIVVAKASELEGLAERARVELRV